MQRLAAMNNPSPSQRFHPGLTLALLASAQFIVAVDFNIVYVALPSIAQALGFSQHHLQWVISAYALTFGGFLLLGGRMGDIVGRRTAFVTALIVYAGSSLAGGLAKSPELLVAARAVQGLGGALLLPTTLSLISTFFDEGAPRIRALSVMGAAGASGGASGALLGGLLTSALGWNWTFFVNVPVAAVAAGLALVLLPADGVSVHPVRVDVSGAFTVTCGMTALVLAFVEGPELGWSSPVVGGLFVLSFVLVAVFLWIQSKSPAPMMPLRLLKHPTLPSAMVLTALFAAGFGAQYYLLTTYLQDVRHLPPASAGLAFLPFSLSIVAGTRIGGRLASAFGLRLSLISGLLTGALGLTMIGLSLSSEANYWTHLLPGFIIDGLGQGMTWTLMWVAATSGIQAIDRGIASGMASTAQQIGNPVGLAILVAIATSGHWSNAEAGLKASFYFAAGVIIVASIVAWSCAEPRLQK